LSGATKPCARCFSTLIVRALQTRWQRVAGLLILEEADVAAVSRQLELALFMDAKLDVAKMPA
jgi:hypothetical protein